VYLLNGIGKIKLQVYLVILSAVFNIPLSIFLGKEFGLPGIIFANTIVFVFMGIVFSIQCKMILNNTAKNIWIK
jgi:O-antigen/teichoic acid export membrane protein